MESKSFETMPTSETDDVEEVNTIPVNLTIVVCLAAQHLSNHDQKEVSKSAYLLPFTCFHITYTLLPDEDPVDIDVNVFDYAAKIYLKDETKCVKIWKNLVGIWIAWTQCHTFKPTKKNLLKLFDYQLIIKCSDKENVSTKARSDRVKGFFYLNTRDTSLSVSEDDESRPTSQNSQEVLFTEASLAPPWAELTEETVSQKTSKVLDTTSSEIKFILLGSPPQYDQQLLNKWIIRNEEDIRDSMFYQPVHKQISLLSQYNEQGTKVSSAASEKFHGKEKKIQKGIVSPVAKGKQSMNLYLDMKMKLFFSGIKSQVSLCKNDEFEIGQIFALVSFEDELLSPKYKEQLNPFTIILKTVSDLPVEPKVDYSSLAENYNPVYLRYKFFNQSWYETTSFPHASTIKWQDSQVYLTENFDVFKFREYLLGPPLQIEIHDRDVKSNVPTNSELIANCLPISQEDQIPLSVKNALQPKISNIKGAIFGVNPQDKYLSSPALIGCKNILKNPAEPVPPRTLFGLAELNLAPLTRQQLKISFEVPVLACRLHPYSKKIFSEGIDKNVPKSNMYLDANTTLKAQVLLSWPLKPLDQCLISLPISTPIFGRIVYLFERRNKIFLRNILNWIEKINKENLEKKNICVYNLGLSIPLFKKTSFEDPNIDIITGFHLFDDNFNIFIVEGQYDGSIKTLWKNIEIPRNQDGSFLEVLYDSSFAFSERLYNWLPCHLCHIHLQWSLCKMFSTSDLYLSKHPQLPDACFIGLWKIWELLVCTSFKEVAAMDLFPTTIMLESISRILGKLLCTREILDYMQEPKLAKK